MSRTRSTTTSRLRPTGTPSRRCSGPPDGDFGTGTFDIDTYGGFLMVFLGRAPEPRTVSVIKTSSTAITGVAGTYSLKDVGRSITGTAIPAGTTVYAVASDTAAT